MTEKEEILKLLREMTASTSGKPPGSQAFSKATGISKYAWGGKYWTSWSEAVKEAGLQPQASPRRLESKFILDQTCRLVLALGKFPSNAELLIAKRKNPAFPHRSIIKKRFGSMSQLARRVLEHAKKNPEFVPVIALCGPHESNNASVRGGQEGWVYLVTDGRRHKIGRTQSLEDRIPELSYQSSARVDLIHKIRTDDPPGIEKYWHDRFSAKRKFGEWFELDANDIAAFRKRRTFM